MIRCYIIKSIFLFLLIGFFTGNIWSADSKFKEITRFDIPEARQGVAVDDIYFYAIGTREIGKYEKHTGKLAAKWKEKDNGPIIHLDSGVIIEGKLYCAHSNYPGVPMTSSVEIWNAETLQHIGSYSFGFFSGSCTWIDYNNGYWWGAFAHYDKLKLKTGKGSEWSTLVKFDNKWHPLESWAFPEELIKRFIPMSNSGGSWGPDGLLYCTGHDRAELYVLKLPKTGSILELIEMLLINSGGQGIAWDRFNPGVIYTILKKDRQVVVFQMTESK